MTKHQLTLQVGDPFRLRTTFRLTAMGSRDPTCKLSETTLAQTFITPDGPALLQAVSEETGVRCEVTGPGTELIVNRIPAYFGTEDSADGFVPTGPLASLAKQLAGTRLPRSPVVFHRLIQIVLQQLVSWDDAAATWRSMVRKYGTPSEIDGLYYPPEPSQLTRLGYYDLVACGALPKQGRLILGLARNARRIERLAADGPDRLVLFLKEIRGIGPWTIGYLRGFAFGDPDVLITGDYGLPHYVSWFLKKQPRSGDAEMEQLLAPYRGLRFRALHLIMQSGTKPPRYGPKMASNRQRNRR
ncbi:MAG: DNA-3-methyladenine glycosylase [Planctomycetaceae bacterium]